jgi:hypothetical protein
MSIRLAEEQVRDTLQQVTAPIRPVSTLLPDVRHRIRRTRTRRRVAQTGVTLAILAMAVSAFTLRPTADGGSPVTEASGATGTMIDSYLMTRPTGGDLRGDQQMIASVMSTWQAYGSTRDLTGPQHLAWVGTTPVGQAAIGIQPASPSTLEVTYFLAYQDAPLKVAGGGPVSSTGQTFGAVLLGADQPADQPVVLSFDTGQGMEYSTGRTFGPDGRIYRDYDPVDYNDGAAVITLESVAQAREFKMRRTGVSSYQQQVYVANIPPSPHQDADARTLWGGDLPLTPDVGQPPEVGTRLYDQQRQRFNTALYDAGYAEDLPSGESDWYAYATLPGGTELIAAEYQVDAVSRTYAVLFQAGSEPRVVYGQRVDRNAPLQVCIKLPDRLGWVAVELGATLNWPGGSAKDAALLPADTPAVTVTEDGGSPHEIPLTR